MLSIPDFCGSIGNTPLIRLNKLSEFTGCEILGKAEFLNPGGSVKDRAVLGIVESAEKNGLLKPGGTIVEGTAGNTGQKYMSRLFNQEWLTENDLPPEDLSIEVMIEEMKVKL